MSTLDCRLWPTPMCHAAWHRFCLTFLHGDGSTPTIPFWGCWTLICQLCIYIYVCTYYICIIMYIHFVYTYGYIHTVYIYTHHIYIFYKMYIHMHIILCLYMVFKTQCDELSIFAVGHWWGPDGFHLSEDGRVLKDWKYFFVCAKTEHLLFA